MAAYFFGLEVPDLHLETFLNAASLLAVGIVYRSDLTELATGTYRYLRFRRSEDWSMFRFALLLLVGTIPAVLVGGLFYRQISGHLTSMTTVAVALLITGGALYLVRKLRGHKREAGITFVDALLIGLAQALALAPGVSRSGATVVAALARKVEAETALKYSFFLSIPASLGSLVLTGDEILQTITAPGAFSFYLAAFLVSLGVSIVAIKLFIEVLTSGKLIYFAGYCITVSVLLMIFA